MPAIKRAGAWLPGLPAPRAASAARAAASAREAAAVGGARRPRARGTAAREGEAAQARRPLAFEIARGLLVPARAAQDELRDRIAHDVGPQKNEGSAHADDDDR